MTELTKKNDFIEIKYTGYANNQVFDSNVEEDLKKLNPEAKAEKTVIVVGQEMVVKGLDRQLEGKEIGKDYEIFVSAKEGFGERKRNLIRTIPLAAFTEQKVFPEAGMVLSLNNSLVKIIAVSGARVTADFNNPLASKEVKYKVKIVRKVEDEKEKTESLLKFFMFTLPEYEIKEKEILVKGPKILETAVNIYKNKFKELLGKDVLFEEKKVDKKEKQHEHEHSEHEHDSHEHHEHHDHHHEHEGHDHSHHDHEGHNHEH